MSLKIYIFFFQQSIYITCFICDTQILAFLRAKSTDQEDLYQWVLSNFAQVSYWHFCMPSFQNRFPSYSAQSQMTQQQCSCILSGQLSLPFLSSPTLFWHYLLLSLLNAFLAFYYILFGLDLFLTLLPFFHLCWYFYDSLPYTHFFHFVNICVLTVSQIIWNLRHLFPLSPICSRFLFQEILSKFTIHSPSYLFYFFLSS